MRIRRSGFAAAARRLRGVLRTGSVHAPEPFRGVRRAVAPFAPSRRFPALIVSKDKVTTKADTAVRLCLLMAGQCIICPCLINISQINENIDIKDLFD